MDCGQWMMAMNYGHATYVAMLFAHAKTFKNVLNRHRSKCSKIQDFFFEGMERQ